LRWRRVPPRHADGFIKTGGASRKRAKRSEKLLDRPTQYRDGQATRDARFGTPKSRSSRSIRQRYALPA